MLRASERARDRSRRGLSRLGSFNRDSDDEASRESSGLHRRVCDTDCRPRHGEERSRRWMDGRPRVARLMPAISRSPWRSTASQVTRACCVCDRPVVSVSDRVEPLPCAPRQPVHTKVSNGNQQRSITLRWRSQGGSAGSNPVGLHAEPQFSAGMAPVAGHQGRMPFLPVGNSWQQQLRLVRQVRGACGRPPGE